MFDSITDLATRLAATGYFIDPVMIKVVYLAARMQKPLLLEGPAGSGKTQLAVSVAKAAGTHIERLQCYRGVTEDQAIGKFDEGLQRLYMEFARGEHADWQSVQASLKGRDFFRAGPLMRALECERPCVLLIDELDKVDEGYRYSKGGQFEQLLYGGFASLMCSGMLRALEGFMQHAGPTSADGFWIATMSLVNWVANVILPVFALTQLAAMALHMGGVVSEIYPGSTWIRKFIAAMGALLVSGMVRLAESMVTHAHGI